MSGVPVAARRRLHQHKGWNPPAASHCWGSPLGCLVAAAGFALADLQGMNLALYLTELRRGVNCTTLAALCQPYTVVSARAHQVGQHSVFARR